MSDTISYCVLAFMCLAMFAGYCRVMYEAWLFLKDDHLLE